MLLDPGDGDIAASDLQIRLDVAQLIAELALAVGPDRAADLAVEKMSADDLVAVVSLLQPVALARPTRKALRRRRDVLPALRTRLLAAVPGGEVEPVQLERIRLRTLVTLVASVAAVYLLAGELARASLGSVLRTADWRWGIAALALSAATYAGATVELSGFVAERLPFFRTLLAQVAGSFVTLVTPAAVGGATLNIRYLQRRKIPAAVAAASVGVSQVVAFVLHVLLIIVFAAIAGSSGSEPIHPPQWTWFVLAGLVLIALVVLAIPAGRRVLRPPVADARPGAAAAARGRAAPGPGQDRWPSSGTPQARALLQRAHERGIRAAFVTGDEVYGGRDLRRAIRARGMGYMLAVRANHTLTLGSGRTLTAAEAVKVIPTAPGSGCAPGTAPRAAAITTGRCSR